MPSVGRSRKKVIKMVTTRFDIEKFSRKKDFGLWKMKALLVHQGLVDAFKGDLVNHQPLMVKNRARTLQKEPK
ncbi:hypothetical protein ACS0TY_027152 [Phlomoides rotata]